MGLGLGLGFGVRVRVRVRVSSMYLVAAQVVRPPWSGPAVMVQAGRHAGPCRMAAVVAHLRELVPLRLAALVGADEALDLVVVVVLLLLVLVRQQVLQVVHHARPRLGLRRQIRRGRRKGSALEGDGGSSGGSRLQQQRLGVVDGVRSDHRDQHASAVGAGAVQGGGRSGGASAAAELLQLRLKLLREPAQG